MPITILPKTAQATGSFDGGAIVENKPIGFPGEGGLGPYSNLFYWAHAWSDKGGLIGEHPHQGFEILSFVLKGEIEHYDNKQRDWIRLGAGSVQIIRAGKGISHAEKFIPGSSIFQIWLDPNLRKTLSKPASYSDYRPEQFPTSQADGITTRTFSGPNGGIEMDTPNVAFKEISFIPGVHTLELNPETVYSLYLLEGSIELESTTWQPNDFAIVKKELALTVQALTNSRVFVIESPLEPGYSTYAHMQGYAG